ncbi:dienelactone hydrolase family protein [Allorhizocola rhizosphaerae]|uniref:dienelactone hydrolase family protein n=1 Tax=Allorhizocola rhizosphaerae TaxID=1872709 RepID=UPI001B8C2D21|nr:dienelactone hydrolase family protein [Allorhizocola rhizosphaerae]
MPATIMRPEDPRGVVIFAHGSGSSRHSPRNRMVAGHLTEDGHVTVLMDLLTPDEEERRFDIELLASRLGTAIDWAHRSFPGLPIGLFGASTGAAAALVAAAGKPVRAIVSRGGRPDLAGEALREVTAPTLLIVGGNDDIVIQLNEAAAQIMGGWAKLVIVPGATHLFPEPGALEQVAELARDWFDRHMSPAGAARR